MEGYIEWIRSKVGSELIILNFAVACIEGDGGSVLMHCRNVSETSWSLPGGAIEPGESAEEAVVREVKEETGLTVKVDHLIGIYSRYFQEYDNGDRSQTIVTLFKCSILEGELKADNTESFGFRYVTKDTIPDLYNLQQVDMLNDFFSGHAGVYR